jgi:hypothetical protein
MVVARFSFFAFLAMQAGLLGLTFGSWWLVLGEVHDRYGVPASQDPFTWFYCLVSPFFLWLAFAQARQFLFHDRRAVWVEDATLCYFTQLSFRPVRRVPLGAIKSFSAGKVEYRSWIGYDGIRIEAEDVKWQGAFMTWPLSERRDVVLARLNQALADSRR